MINFDVGIHEIIQRLAILSWRKSDVAADAELHAIVIPMTKKELTLLRVLPCFGDVDGNPSVIAGVEIGPAVVAGDFARVFICGYRKADLEARRNLLRAGHRNEERVEIGAVAPFCVACVESVSVSPACAALVIA